MMPRRAVTRAFSFSPERYEMLEQLAEKGEYSMLVSELVQERWDQVHIDGLRDAVVKLMAEYKKNAGMAQ